MKTVPIARDGFKEAIEMATWRVGNLLSRSAFAKAVGMTYRAVLDIESGKRRPRKSTYDKFCELRDRYAQRNRGLTAAQIRHLKVYGVIKPKGKGRRSPWTTENHPFIKYREKKKMEAVNAGSK